MKQSTSELNATVVVVLAIGVLMAFFYYTLWPMFRENFESKSRCSKAICDNVDQDKDGFVVCHSKDNPDREFECVFKG